MGEMLSLQEIVFYLSSLRNQFCDLGRRGGRKWTVMDTSVLSDSIRFMLIALCRIFFFVREVWCNHIPKDILILLHQYKFKEMPLTVVF